MTPAFFVGLGFGLLIALATGYVCYDLGHFDGVLFAQKDC